MDISLMGFHLQHNQTKESLGVAFLWLLCARAMCCTAVASNGRRNPDSDPSNPPSLGQSSSNVPPPSSLPVLPFPRVHIRFAIAIFESCQLLNIRWSPSCSLHHNCQDPANGPKGSFALFDSLQGQDHVAPCHQAIRTLCASVGRQKKRTNECSTIGYAHREG